MEQRKLSDSPVGQLLEAITIARKVCPDRVPIYQRQLEAAMEEQARASQATQQI